MVAGFRACWLSPVICREKKKKNTQHTKDNTKNPEKHQQRGEGTKKKKMSRLET